MVNGRQKGNKAERDVIAVLRKHFGGEPWQRRSMGVDGYDIITPDWFRWAIEVKDRKSVKLKHLWKPTKELRSFWQQAVDQSLTERKKPLLVIKIEGLWFAIDSPYFGSSVELFEDWCEEEKGNADTVA